MNSKPFYFLKRFWALIALCFFVVFTVIFLNQQSITAQAIGVPTKTIPVDPAIMSLQKELQSYSIDDPYRNVLETKVAVLSYDATRQAIGRVKIPAYQPTQKLPPTETENPKSERLMGIIDNPSVPFSPMEVLIENAWQSQINNEFVLVFAGATRADPEKGVLIIATEHPLNFKFVYLPGTGSIKIIDFKGSQLVIQSKSKETIYFDVPGQVTIKSLGEKVPTVTPINKLQSTSVISTATPGFAYP